MPTPIKMGSLFNSITIDEEKLKEYQKNIKNDKDIKEFIKTHELDDIEVKDNLTLFSSYISERNKGGGMVPVLIYEGYNHIALSYKFKDDDQQQRVLDKVSTALRFDESNKDLKGLTFSDLDQDENNTPFIKSLQLWIDNYSYKTESKGVWLSGTFGIGKTYLMGAFANELNKKGAGVVLTSTTSLLNEIKESYDFSASYNPLESTKRAEVLIIDDIGAERLNEWSFTQLYDLIEYRMQQKKPTFFTSNYSIDDYMAIVKGVVSLEDAGRYENRLKTLTIDRDLRMKGENKR